MTSPGAIPEFDPCEDLPTGTMVLEASAGTGKTYAIVSLAVRYLAQGVPVDRLLMATFSRAASNELRDRTRTRIVEALAALEAPATILAASDADPVLDLLCRGTDEERAQRRRRLVDALSDFDAATVATTHTFCNRMLGALGFLGERSQQYPIVEDVSDLTAELTRDLYLKGFAGAADQAPPFAAVTDVARAAVEHASTDLSPDFESADEATRLRLELALAAREEIARRKHLARIRTYDDLQDVLHSIVTDDLVGERARARIREQFDVVLIDEFQDTDPQQWEIVRECFHKAKSIPLILVGDPKQSIYAFRGAEVHSYLGAVREATQRRRLGINWRSDGPLVTALHAVFEGTEFGDPAITFTPVAAHEPRSLVRTGADTDGGAVDPDAEKEGRCFTAPLRLRVLVPRDFGSGDLPSVREVRSKVTDDVADDIAALLSSGTRIEAGTPAAPRPVEPGDIAILVNFNSTVEPLQEALRRHGVSSVVRSGTSIFKTPGARYWWYVLAAIEQPSSTAKVRLAALTPLVGWTAEQLDAAGDEGVGELAGTFAHLGRLCADNGFAAMSARLFAEFDTEVRLLGGAGGERLQTDLRQLSDLCNRHSAAGGSGVAPLVAWLEEQIADPSGRRHGGSQTRRLERDTRAVQIMTVHASKGLEFPIVYVPFGWDGARVPDKETFLFHSQDKRRLLDVGGPQSPGYREREDASVVEAAGESLRLLYVAMTRARSQVVTWWGPSMPTKQGAFHRLAFTAGERAATVKAGSAGTPIPVSVEIPQTGLEMVAGLRELASGARDQIAVEQALQHPAGLSWRASSADDAVPALSAARFTAAVDQGWRRTSYSGITRDAHEHGPAARTEPEGPTLDDEPDHVDSGTAPADPVGSAGGMPSLMNGLPFGAGFGTLVHEVLEHVDTAAPDLAAHVRQRTAEGAQHSGMDLDVDQLAAALMGVLTTPLGFGDLAGIGPGDRLAELDFEMPLAAPGFTLGAVGDLLVEHLPSGDPLAAYAELVRTVSSEAFRGFLTGSIDSVLRTPQGRFVVVDYKTNRLRPGDLKVDDFDTATMAAEMMTAHYPLQALLYSVALHRYLRWRLPAYSPTLHLGPVQYHFVRGMAGPQTPAGCGVFEWSVPTALVLALSDLLAGEVA